MTRGITTAHTSRAATPHTSRATTPHTPAQKRDCHVRNTQPGEQSEGACTQQPREDLRKKSNDEDHCTRQKRILPKEAEEKGTPRRGDRCACQTRCTQTTSYTLAVRLTSTPTDTSLTHTHQHLPVYHTTWVDMTTREDVITQSGSVDVCLGQVHGQRECSTWH